MKKINLLVLLLICSGTIAAQPLSKKGEIMIPEEGDWGIGIDAQPFLQYLGRIFTPVNEAPSAAFAGTNMAITARRFTRADFAQRASLRLSIANDRWTSFSPEYSVDPTNLTVEDAYSRTISNIYLSYGIEKRRGKTRVQGFYGIEGILGYGSERHKFDYGNKISQENPAPDRTNWEIQLQDGTSGEMTFTEEGAYVSDYKIGNTFSLGARAFIGAEVFVFPKMSLGIELGVTAGVEFQGNGEYVTEQWSVPPGGTGEQVVINVVDTGSKNTIGINTNNTGGAVFLFFYF